MTRGIPFAVVVAAMFVGTVAACGSGGIGGSPTPGGESTLEASIDVSVVAPGDFAICLYRDPGSHRVRALELTPVAAAILEEIERADRPLVDVLRVAAERCGVAIDASFVQSFADVASDWMERGLWLGSSASGEGKTA